MSYNSPNILIVGGTGFLGYHLARACLKLKWNVSSISTKKPLKFRKIKSVKYYFMDISKKKSLFNISKKILIMLLILAATSITVKKKPTTVIM